MSKYAELTVTLLIALMAVLYAILPWVISYGSDYEKTPQIEFKVVCDQKDYYGRETCRLVQI